MPTPQELPERLDAVLQVVYLVFNEGYSAAAGAEVTRAELTGEAIRLGRLLARTPAGAGGDGPACADVAAGIAPRRQNLSGRRADLAGASGPRRSGTATRSRRAWRWWRKLLRSRRFGAYTLQAAIAAVHAEAPSAASTDWRQIVALYNQLVRIQPSPVVDLNRAVAIAMCDGPEQGLRLIDALLEHGEFANYYLAHSARADLCRRLGRIPEARASYEKALALTQQEPERQFLQERIRQLK